MAFRWIYKHLLFPLINKLNNKNCNGEKTAVKKASDFSDVDVLAPALKFDIHYNTLDYFKANSFLISSLKNRTASVLFSIKLQLQFQV